VLRTWLSTHSAVSGVLKSLRLAAEPRFFQQLKQARKKRSTSTFLQTGQMNLNLVSNFPASMTSSFQK
jgi:hypothetical protein